MSEDFVPFNLAVKLKEKGYPQQCGDDAYILEDEYEEFEVGSLEFIPLIPEHVPTVVAPTISQVLKWLREEKEIYVDVITCPTYATLENVMFDVVVKSNSDGYAMNEYSPLPCNNKWEKAAIEGIEYTLENLL